MSCPLTHIHETKDFLKTLLLCNASINHNKISTKRMEIEYTFHISVFVFILSYDFKDITNETYWNLKIFNKNSEKMIFLNIYTIKML